MINFFQSVFWIRLFPLFIADFLLVSCISPAASVQPTASLEATLSGPFAKNLPASTPQGGLVEEMEHFTIYYLEGEQASASFI